MKLNKKAFTLTELLVALAVIGVLIAILMPVIMNIMPNQKDLMAKRAYYTIQSVVSNLLNDSACYPEEVDDSGNEIVGFANGYGYADCDLWHDNIDEQGDVGEKFFTLFFDKLQRNPDNMGDPTTDPTGRLITKDGMVWYFQNEAGNNRFTVAIDVNGDDRGGGADTNIGPVSEFEGRPTNCQRDCDIAVFEIGYDGDVRPLGGWTTQAVRADRSINSD